MPPTAARPGNDHQRTPPVRRRWGRWLAAAVSFAVLATACGGRTLLAGVGDAIGRVDAFGNAGDRPPDDGVTTFLVAGTDDREGIPASTLKGLLHAGGESCHCTDTLMVVQLAEHGGRASVVSIPRDSYVVIPAHRDLATGREVPEGHGKVNAAYGMGGPALTVRTVERNTGLRIDHYLQVDFLSFVSTVDALGGVEVCTAKPLKDQYSGLDLPAGTTRLDGAGALKYVRARHVDGSSDLGRMQRQQKFLAQLLRQATGSGTLLNPVKLTRVTETVLRSVKADQDLSSADLVALATQLKDLSPATADFATVPLKDVNHQVEGWGSTVLWDPAGAKALFDAVRGGRALTERAAAPSVAAAAAAAPGAVPPGQIRIQVLNGAGTAGLGARVDGDLRKAGFATTGAPSNAGGGSAVRTVVRYDPRWDESVKTLAAALPYAELVQAPGLGATMQVIAGSDYTGALPGQASPSAAAPSATAPAVTASTGADISCP
ncbi:LCP family protein [Kitasatospora sp. NPDC051853]|uniref:LCP family protein n=1 Tax=Kitasatospora sp. NPDC051853 TaxID=3364058 RepID=UPI0037B5A1FA